MTTADEAKDLATVEPRGLDAELEGYAWIPRMLDKARATLAHTNGSYLFGCPVDHTCMARLGVSPELVLELAGRYPDDTEWLSAMREHGIPPADETWFDGRAVEDERRRRPVGPALDPLERGGIARGNEKIGAAERRAVRQIDRELPHRIRVRLLTVSLSLWCAS